MMREELFYVTCRACLPSLLHHSLPVTDLTFSVLYLINLTTHSHYNTHKPQAHCIMKINSVPGGRPAFVIFFVILCISSVLATSIPDGSIPSEVVTAALTARQSVSDIPQCAVS